MLCNYGFKAKSQSRISHHGFCTVFVNIAHIIEGKWGEPFRKDVTYGTSCIFYHGKYDREGLLIIKHALQY